MSRPNKTIEQGAEWIRKGGVVAFPTETVYGLGADALNSEAVLRLFKIKQRPLNNPLIIHIAEPQQAHALVKKWPEAAEKLARAFWPGPLTLVLKKSKIVPDSTTGGNDTVGIRIPANPLARQLIQHAGTPVAAPSANLFGCISPTTAAHVESQLKGQYDLLIDGGACPVGVESTVVSLTGDHPKILRPGGITAEEIEAVIGSVQEDTEIHQGKLESPGMLSSHYAPETPLTIHQNLPAEWVGRKEIGWLLPTPPQQPIAGPVEVLSEQGCLAESATNLYAAMRRLDALGLSQIIAQRTPNQGIGKAINNRLEKASSGEIFTENKGI